MADPLSVAASVIGIAAFGIKIANTLTTFINVYRSTEAGITGLAAGVALTSSVLKEIGETIKTYEKECQLTVRNFVETKDTCERNFDVLFVALRVVKKNSVGNGVTQVKKIDMWAKLRHALGGEQELKDLVTSIETSKSNLQLLLHSLNLTILRSLSKKNLLSDEQADDFKLFMAHLPALVSSIQQAGLMPSPVYKGKEKIEGNLISVTMLAVNSGVGRDDPPDYIQEETMGVKDLTIAAPNLGLKKRMMPPGDNQGNQKRNPTENPDTKLFFKKPDVSMDGGKGIGRGDTFEGLEQHDLVKGVSLIEYQVERTINKETHDDLAIKETPPKAQKSSDIFSALFKQASNDSPEKKREKTLAESGSDQDAPEMEASKEPVSPRAAPSRETRETSTAPDILEGWILAPETPYPVMPSIISICGLRIRIFASHAPFDYKTSFLTQDQTVLKGWLPNAVLERSNIAPHTIALAELPQKARFAVEDLLDDRKDNTREPHSWKIEFISLYTSPEETASNFWQRKFSRKAIEKETKWKILLRGGILLAEDSTARRSIERYRDPWREEAKHRTEDVEFELPIRKKKFPPRGSPAIAVPVDAFEDITRLQEQRSSDWAWTGPSKKSKKDKKGKKGQQRSVADPIEVGEYYRSPTPGGFDSDIDFAATVSAGLQDSGFDPKIVIDDPSYRKRDSPPADCEPKKATFPQDPNYSPKSEGSASEHDFELKPSKKGKKKKMKASRRRNSEFELFGEAKSIVEVPADAIPDSVRTERRIWPAIDPQYGDLLPLPPSDSNSLNDETLGDLPRLPSSRPETPESNRERVTAGPSIKYPSHTAVPLKFRSHPTHPTSWDNTREYKPLYLVESKTSGTGVQQRPDETPLPELPSGIRGPRDIMRERAERDQKWKEKQKKEDPERYQEEARFWEEQRLINAEWGAMSKVAVGAGAAIGPVGGRGDSSRSQRKFKTRSHSISSLEGSESDLGEGSRWKRGSEENEDEEEEILSEEQAERLMNAYLDTFTVDEDDE